MIGAYLTSYGGPQTVLPAMEIPRPEPGSGQVLVKVLAASINPSDIKLIHGAYKDSIPLTLPIVPGGDIAGVVAILGDGVPDMKVGDEIYGGANILSGGSGAFAEFAVANATQIAPKPSVVTFPEAASLPLAGVSAVQAITEHLKLEGGQKILIHGGAGGIGSIAVQLAKAIGALVTATAAGDDKGFVHSLGAETVIDYRTEAFEEKVSGMDAVFDTVGGTVAERSFQVLRRGGTMVSMLGAPDQEKANDYGITAIGQNSKITRTWLARLTEYIEKGSVKPQVDRVFSLEDVREALSSMETGSPRGKVVLAV